MAIIRHEINLVNLPVWAGDYAYGARITTASYSGTCAWYVESCGKTYGAGTTITIKDSSGNTHATLSFSETVMTTKRVEFSTPPTTDDYIISVTGDCAAYTLKLICLQDISTDFLTASESQIEIGGYQTTTSTDPLALTNPKYFTYTSANWDGTISAYFEAHLRSNNASGISYAVLQEDDGSWENWTGIATLSVSGTTLGRVRSSNIFSELTNSRHYRIVFYSNNSSYTAVVYNAKIIFVQTGTSITKLEETQLAMCTVDSGSTGLQSRLTKYNATDWTDTTVTFKYAHDATNANDASKLYNVTDSTDVTGVITGANQQISDAFDAPTDGDILDVNVTNTTGLVCYGRILIQINLTSNNQSLSMNGINHTNTFGIITINTTYNLGLTGINSTISIGVLDYYKILIQTLTGINSTINFGNITYNVGITWIEPIDITPASENEWVDVDLSGYIAIGSTGVFLHIVNNSISDFNVQCRKNGSTDDRIYGLEYLSHQWIACGVDENKILELNIGSTTDIDVYLIGYTDNCAVFNTNATDISIGVAGEWTDIDINVGNGAIGAIIETGTNNRSIGLRQNGSSDNNYSLCYRPIHGFTGVDGNEIFEAKVSSIDVKLYLKGYFKSNVSFLTNARNISLSSIYTYTDITLPSNSTGGFIEVITSVYGYNYALRKNGSSENISKLLDKKCFATIQSDENHLIEGRVEGTEVDFYLTGYSYSTKNVSINWIGLTNSNSFGSISFIYNQNLSLTGIDSTANIGTPVLNSNYNLILTGISSTVSFGTPTITVQSASNGVTWITPVEITPGSASAWTDVDVSSYVASGTSGILLHVVHNSTNYRYFGCRNNGSTDARYKSATESHLWVACGIDENDVCEIYVSSTTEVDVYLVGYFDDCAVFNTNATDVSLDSIGAWTDIDLGVNDNAIGAIVEMINSSTTYTCGLRKNGSTDNRYLSAYSYAYGFIGVDGNEIFEGYISNIAVDFFLKGYIKSEVTFLTNATDLSLDSIDDYYDLSALPSGATGEFIEICPSGNNYALRKNGSSEDIYYKGLNRHNWATIECDESQLIEGKISNTSVDFFLTGYTTSGSSASQNLSLIGISSSATIGTSTLIGNQNLTLTGISSSISFGTITYFIGNVNLSLTGISSSVSIGTSTISSNYNLVLIGISSTNIFGTPVSLTGNVNLSLVEINSTLSIGNISFYGVGTLSLTGISSTITIGTINFGLGITNLIETGINSTLIIGTPLFSIGEVVLNLTSISSTSNFGAFSFNKGEVILSLSGINSTLSIGTPSLIIGLVLMGIPSSTTIGNIIFEKGNINLTLTGINSTAIISNLIFNSDLILTGINSTTTINSIIFQTQYNLLTNSIDSTLIIGNPILINLLQFLLLSSINSSLVFGNISLNLNLNVSGINSTLTIGSIILYSNINIPISSIVSSGSLGIISFVVGNVNLPLIGINSTLSIGNMKVIPLIKPSGINSTVTLGTLIITTTRNGITWIDPIEITPAVAGVWTDIDLTGTVWDGTTGVMLQVETTDVRLEWGARCNGSTDNRHQEQYYASHTGFAVGLDINLVLELYVESTTNVNVYLVGYCDDSVVFNVNATNISLEVTDVWTDINISVGESLVGALIEVNNTEYNTSHSFGIRKNGSTDNRYTYLLGKTMAFIGVDGSYNCEGKVSSTNVDFYLTGYVKNGCVFNTNATDLSLTTTGVYRDLIALPSDASGGFIEYSSAGISVYTGALRKNGSSLDIYRSMTRHGWIPVQCDENKLIEGKISNTSLDFFLTGYTSIVSQTLNMVGILSSVLIGHIIASIPYEFIGINNIETIGTISFIVGNTNLIISSILSAISFGTIDYFCAKMTTTYKITLEIFNRDLDIDVNSRRITMNVNDRNITSDIT